MKKTASRTARAVRTQCAKTLIRELTGMGFAHSTGTAMTHTQALDLLAKLEGFNSHGHKSFKQKSAPTQAAVQAVVERAETGFSAVSIAQHWLETGGESTRFPKSDWQYEVNNEDTTRSYAAWLLAQHYIHMSEIAEMRNLTYADKVGVEFYCELADCNFETRDFKRAAREIKVTEASGKDTVWNLEPNLSSRWGELNTDSFEEKPGFVKLVLEGHEGINKLMELMAEEMCFIAECDGEVGLLVEYELYTRESALQDGSKDADSQPTRAQAHESSKANMLAEKPQDAFPWARFAVADAEDHDSFGNTVVMAFVSLKDIRKNALQYEDIQKVCHKLWQLG